MSISNGQLGNASNLNAAFVSRATAQALSGGKTFNNYLATDWLDVATTATITALASTQSAIRMTGSTATEIQGIAAGQDGQHILIHNASTAIVTLKHQNTGASSANRLILPSDSDVQINANASAELIYDLARTKWVVKSGSGSSAATGGGSKNYLSANIILGNTGNGDFELNSVAGWSKFNTTLTALVPTGSITLTASSVTTFATTSTGKLAGAYSLEVASSSAWTAGQGFISSAFSIDLEDRAKVLTGSFYFSVTANASNGNFSGTSSNTFAVYVYDVTNSAWIQPAGVYGMTQSAGVGKCSFSFQTSYNSSQYQIAIVAVNASAGAITMLFDDFSVGPQTAPIGMPGSDWVAYTPTTNGLGVPSSVECFWRRIGSNIQIMGKLIVGTTTAAEMRVGLPSVTSADISIIPSIKICGTLNFTGTNTVGQYNVLCEPSVGYVTFSLLNGSFSGLSKVNGNTFLSTGNGINFTAELPISGFSANVKMSNDTDTRVVAAQIGLTSNVSPTINTVIKYDTVLGDTHAAYSTSTGLYTAPVSGYYRVSASGQTSAGTAQVYIQVSGSSKVNLFTTGTTTVSGGSATVFANAGQTLGLFTDTARTYFGQAAPFLNAISIERLSGPSVIAATESVNASYYVSSNFAASTSVPINFDSKEYDSHNAVTPSATVWNFTAPVSGVYSVSVWYGLTTGTTTYLYIYKNGSKYKSIASNTGTSNSTAGGATSLRLNAGDYIELRPNGSVTFGGASLSGDATNIAINRVGN